MYILVTGGLGYVGSHFISYYLQQSNTLDIIIIDNLNNSKNEVLDNLRILTNKKILFFCFDLANNITEIDNIFKTFEIYTVIHCAGLKSVYESIAYPLTYYKNNIISTLNLLEIMYNNKCHNIIFSSSATVYGTSILPLTEDSEVGNGITSPYGKSKYFQEEIIKDFCYSNQNFKAVIFRYFNPIGEHVSGLLPENPKNIPNNIFPYICKVARKELEFLNIFGSDYNTKDGTCVRDFIDIEDLSNAHIEVINKFGSVKYGVNIYNIGRGQGTTVLDLIHSFESANNINLNYKFAERRQGDRDIVYCNCDKIKKEIGWSAKKNLQESCKIKI